MPDSRQSVGKLQNPPSGDGSYENEYDSYFLADAKSADREADGGLHTTSTRQSTLCKGLLLP